MNKVLKNSWALFTGMGFIMMAYGFQGSLLGVRAVAEDFSLISTGFMMSGYFVGYFIGAITIPNLIYVVDTGFSNTTVYDEDTGKSTSQIMPITDESRLQRRGRVGRTSPGFVYYVYTESHTKNIKIPYPLCVVDDLETHFTSLISIGWKNEQLLDKEGIYYIVHPEENNDEWIRDEINDNKYTKNQRSLRINNSLNKPEPSGKPISFASSLFISLNP